MDSETWSAMAVTLGVSVVVFAVFVGLFWAVKGFMPGSRLYEQDLPSPNDLDSQTAVFRMFYVNWCPHCKDAKPVWKRMEQLLENQKVTFGGKTIRMEQVNCELDKGTCSKYRADAYPTFKLETNKKVYEYVGAPDLKLWTTFFTSALGKKEKSS